MEEIKVTFNEPCTEYTEYICEWNGNKYKIKFPTKQGKIIVHRWDADYKVHQFPKIKVAEE